jgi:hypothetical protein
MSEMLEGQIAALPKLGRQGLQNRWREVVRTVPPAGFTPDLLARGIAHRLQEKAFGGLPTTLCRQLQTRAGASANARPTMRPGNRLVRRWRGNTYVVEVTEMGLLYDGATFGSLSEIATSITGTRWSGPRFFGLPK